MPAYRARQLIPRFQALAGVAMLAARVGAAPAEKEPPGDVPRAEAAAEPVATEAPKADSGRDASSLDDSATPALGDQAALARAATYYEAARYANCVDAFLALLDADSPSRLTNPAVIEEARVYLAACQMATGKLTEADGVFRDAIRANPQLPPPSPVVFPEAVVNRFFFVRAGMLKEIRAMQNQRLLEERQRAAQRAKAREAERLRVRDLERLATLESVVNQRRRWIAVVPFGVGQFQNGDSVLGWTFLSVETLFLGATITGVAGELSLHSLASERGDELDSADLNRKIAAFRRTGQIGVVGLVVSAALGVLEAQLSFVPEVTLGERRRALPPGLQRPPNATRLRPTPSVSADRVGLSLSGTF